MCWFFCNYKTSKSDFLLLSGYLTRYYALSGALVQLLRAYAVTSGRSPSGVQSGLHEVAYFAPCNWSFRSYINEWIVLRGLIISAHMIKAIYMQKLVEHSILLYLPRTSKCMPDSWVPRIPRTKKQLALCSAGRFLSFEPKANLLIAPPQWRALLPFIPSCYVLFYLLSFALPFMIEKVGWR